MDYDTNPEVSTAQQNAWNEAHLALLESDAPTSTISAADLAAIRACVGNHFQ